MCQIHGASTKPVFAPRAAVCGHNQFTLPGVHKSLSQSLEIRNGMRNFKKRTWCATLEIHKNWNSCAQCCNHSNTTAGLKKVQAKAEVWINFFLKAEEMVTPRSGKAMTGGQSWKRLIQPRVMLRRP